MIENVRVKNTNEMVKLNKYIEDGPRYSSKGYEYLFLYPTVVVIKSFELCGFESRKSEAISVDEFIKKYFNRKKGQN